jgi:hypothetical protein
VAATRPPGDLLRDVTAPLSAALDGGADADHGPAMLGSDHVAAFDAYAANPAEADSLGLAVREFSPALLSAGLSAAISVDTAAADDVSTHDLDASNPDRDEAAAVADPLDAATAFLAGWDDAATSAASVAEALAAGRLAGLDSAARVGAHARRRRRAGRSHRRAGHSRSRPRGRMSQQPCRGLHGSFPAARRGRRWARH